MARGLDPGAVGAAIDELRDDPVQPPPLPCRDRAVDRVAHELVAEVDLAGSRQFLEEGMGDELSDRLGQVFLRSIQDPPDRSRRKSPAEDRAGSGDLTRPRRAVPEPLEDRRLDRVRDARRPDVVDGRGRPVSERAEKLLDVERDPVGSLMDRADRLVVDRSIVEQDSRHHRGLFDAQPRQSRLLGEALREEPRSPAAYRGLRRELVGPERRNDEERQIDESPGDRREDVQAQIVGPLEVLEREERRLSRGLGEDVSEVKDQHPTGVTGRRPVGRVRMREPADQRLADRSQLRRATHLSGEVEDDRVGDVPIRRGDEPVAEWKPTTAA